MNRRVWLKGLAAAVILPGQAMAEGMIMVMGASVRPPVVASIKTGALYVTLMNHGSAADKLLSISTPDAEGVELHETVEKDGVVSMVPMKELEIAAGATVELKPNSLHGMITGLKRELKVGESVSFTLTFEHAGQVTTTALVENVGHTHDHSAHTQGESSN